MKINVSSGSTCLFGCEPNSASLLVFKPKVKCGECQHQSFTGLTNDVIQQHLMGRQTSHNIAAPPPDFVAGVYPQLPDGTCRFLAIDFDKAQWQRDVDAFRKTCAEHRVPVAIERSRSGNGSHAWIFIVETVPAGTVESYAVALADYGFFAGKQADLDDAISAYRSIMDVEMRQAVLLKWAADQPNLAGALYFSAVLRNNGAPTHEGRAAVDLAAEEFSAQGQPRKAQATTTLLANFVDLIARLPP